MITQRQKSDIREKKLAQESGGRRVSGSGSSAELKGDISYKGVVRQDKRSEKESIAIKVKDLIKIEFEAMNRGKLPAFSIGFDKFPQENWIAFPEWWVRDQDWWKELRDAK